METTYTKKPRLESLKNHQETQTAIGDIRGVYGIGAIPDNFLNMLGLRAIIRGINCEQVCLPPNPEKAIKDYAEKIKKVLSYEGDIKFENFKEIDPEKREPYMKTPYYWEDNIKFLAKIMPILNLIRKLADKVETAEIIERLGFKNFLPDNTVIFKGGTLNEVRNNVIKEALQRIRDGKSFIIKAGEGASGENMLVVKVTEDFIIIGDKKIGKDISDIKGILKQIFNTTMHIKYKLLLEIKNGLISEYKLPQNFLIQDLVNLNTYKEASINFLITSEGDFFETAQTENLTDGTVHIGNKNVILPKQVLNQLNLFMQQLVKYMKEQLGEQLPTMWLGLDFAYNPYTNEIKIFEINPRYTAPATPTLFLARLQELGYIPENWTRHLYQKFKLPTNFDLANPPEKIKKYLIQEENFDTIQNLGVGYFPYSPPFTIGTNTYQSIIIIGENQNKMNELYKILTNISNLK